MRLQNKGNVFFLLVLISMTVVQSCTEKQDMEVTPLPKTNLWTTSFDRSNLLSASTVEVGKGDPSLLSIKVDTQTQFQTIDGFGYTLTGGSAMLIEKMEASARDKLIKELFGCSEGEQCISYLRISLGASDLSEQFFTYNDLPAGQTDNDLTKFSLSRDTLYLIPLLKRILTIQPNIRFMASPWTAPVWMKTNGQAIGGNLKTEYHAVYARYFARYIKAMQQQGSRIDAVTVQNEPQHGGNHPSMIMSFTQQAEFIKSHLGPVLRSENLSTKIIIWDHNCDNYQYPLAILGDAAAAEYIDGTAFHLYGGEVGALSLVHQAYPDKNLYFTEQWTGGNSLFAEDLKWHTKNVIMGTMRNWSKVALEWNLASDPAFDPHLNGGCSLCMGAVTIDGNTLQRNVSYYIIGQVSRFVKPGAVRISSPWFESVPNVAFKNLDGTKVLLVMNESNAMKKINVSDGRTDTVLELKPTSVTTFVW